MNFKYGEGIDFSAWQQILWWYRLSF